MKAPVGMSPFAYPLMLGFAVLAALPIVLHLLQRQKPKRVLFPAFRFLRQTHRETRRRTKLNNILLLLLRVALLALLCVALAQPRLFGGRFALGRGRPVVAVLVVDTSLSMEYNPGDGPGGGPRLDAVRRQARQLLDDMADDSKVAVLDSADGGGGDDASGWSPTLALARDRLDDLTRKARPANGPVNGPLERGYRMLAACTERPELPRLLFVFTDRTHASWNAGRTSFAAPPADVKVVLVDVGEEQPLDLAIDRVEAVPPVAAPGEPVGVNVVVRATGGDLKTDLICQEDDVTNRPPDRKEADVPKDRSKPFPFVLTAPREVDPNGAPEAPRQVTVRLAGKDALNCNNERYLTFGVRRPPPKVPPTPGGDRPRRVLVVADEPRTAAVWKLALESIGAEGTDARSFVCDVRTPAEVGATTPEGWLRDYPVICLFQTAPPRELWDGLARYVRGGGGLVLVPGFRQDAAFNREATRAGLLPATLEGLEKVSPDAPGVPWTGFEADHPLMAVFRRLERTGQPDFARPGGRPVAYGYWRVQPVEAGTGEEVRVLATYADQAHNPALLERRVGKGHVIQFTVPLEPRRLDALRPWHNYWSRSFGLVLVDQVCRYLSGERPATDGREDQAGWAGRHNFVFAPGRSPVLPVPAGVPPPWFLDGPGGRSEVTPPPGGNFLTFPQATRPGNYLLRDAAGRALDGFSLNVPEEESRLERVDVGDLERVLGQGAVVPAGRTVSLSDVLRDRLGSPESLMPWLMLLVLAGVVAESFLANRFYRNPAAAESAPPPRRLVRAAEGALAGLLAGAVAGAAVAAGVALWAGRWPGVTAYALLGGVLGAAAGAAARAWPGPGVRRSVQEPEASATEQAPAVANASGS